MAYRDRWEIQGKPLFTIYRNSAEIFSLVTAFENCTLLRTEWTHRAYLTVALWYLYTNTLLGAQRLMRNSIKRYNFENNIPATSNDGYHETLTLFWMHAVNNYLHSHRYENSFVRLANGLIESLADENLPLKFYSRERLFSAQAKTRWTKPDLQIKAVSD